MGATSLPLAYQPLFAPRALHSAARHAAEGTERIGTGELGAAFHTRTEAVLPRDMLGELSVTSTILPESARVGEEEATRSSIQAG